LRWTYRAASWWRSF